MNTKLMQTVFALGSVLATLALSACGGGESNNPNATPGPQRPGVLSIAVTPALNPAPSTPQQFAALAAASFDLAYGAGARGQINTYKWSALEPTAGTYDDQAFSEFSQAAAGGLKQFLGIQLINTTARELPSDLQSSAFNDPKVIARFHQLLDRLITPGNKGRIAYLSIGNEVDVYLRAHPSEWSQYKAFYSDAVQYVHALDPAIKVGVTGTGDGALGQSRGDLRDLNAASDVIILTYYPIQLNADATFTARGPGVVAGDFSSMLAFAESKPLVLQEVGYPAATANASSEAMQAQFVSNVFSAWKSSGGRIPFLNYFHLHDFTPELCDSFAAYYNLADSPTFKAYLCSLGLRKDDGTPRAAWNTLRNEATAAGLP